MLTEDIVGKIQVDDAEIVSRMLNDLISSHRTGRGKTVAELAMRYEQKGLPIQRHRVANPTKVDERIPCDFYSDIVDTKQGYMGNEVTIEVDKASVKEGVYDKAVEVLHDFHRLNYSVDQNSEMVKVAARDGVGYRLLYVPEGRAEIRTKLLPASEAMLFTDASLGETQYGIRFWYVEDITYHGTQKVSTKRTAVEWYDKESITYYIDNGRGEYKLDTSKGAEGVQQHLFDGVPIVKFSNNEEGIAEPEKAIALIDAHDTIISATVSEIEQLRLAYMAVKGLGSTVDDEFIQRLEQTGVFPLDTDGDVKFVTKDMAVQGVKIILDELRTNIYQFSRSIDLSKDYGGDLRVIGWQVALLNLENSCKVTERKFSRGLREQYRMVCALWNQWGETDIEYLDLAFTFTRNFPKDLGSEAKILIDLLGGVSRRKAFELVSFIDDPDAELEAVKEDSEFFGSMAESLQDGEPEDVSAPVAEDVQAQALNGAQIKSVVEIVAMVAGGELPEASAVAILKIAIPSLSDAAAVEIIGPAAGFKGPAVGFKV